MNIKKILSENMSPAFSALCVVLLAQGALMKFAGVSNPVFMGITAVVFTALTVFLYLNRKNSAAYVGAAAIFTVIILALNTAGINIFELTVSTVDCFISGKTLDDGGIFLMSAILSAVLSVICFPLMKINYGRLVAAVIALAAFIAYGFAGVEVNPVEIFAAAGIIIIALAEFFVTLQYKKETSKRINAVVSFLLPIFAAFSLAVAVLPSSEEPISWTVVQNIADAVVSFVENVVAEISFALNPASAEFDISMQGYSEAEGVFGAGISSSGSEQLNISAYVRPRSTLYLIGNANSVYTGAGWTKAKPSDLIKADDYYLDYCETICAFERAGYTKADISEFTAASNISVTYGGIITKTLFYPLKTSEIVSADGFNALSPSVVFNGKATEGVSYNLKYLDINYYSDEFIALAQSGYTYGELSAEDHYLDARIPSDINTQLAERAKFIRENYTDVPDCVTARTYELAQQLTANCETDYDKLRVIEAYLRSYTYTTSPGSVPNGYDAIDYFLFESREGYCTYFASAMTILTRCVGIPARYIQGFATDIGQSTSYKGVAVTTTDAHAWAEGYIEGVGWIPFEATAAYADSRYNFRELSHVGSNAYSQTEYFDHHKEYEIDIPELIETKESGIPIAVPIILFSLLGVLLITVLYVTVRLRSFIVGYKKSAETDRFMTCYRMIIYLCGRKRLVRADGETADCFAGRVSELYADESFGAINNAFDKIRYGGASAHATERETAELFLKQRFDDIKKKNGKIAALSAFVGYCFK